MEKLFQLFLIGVVLGVCVQTATNITTLNNAMRVQSAIAKNK
jgi:hypothetical protein